MATKKSKTEWPFTETKVKKPTKKELAAQKLAEQEKLIALKLMLCTVQLNVGAEFRCRRKQIGCK